MAELLDLISARNPGEAKQTLSGLVRGPQNRLRGLLDDPAGFMGSALREGLGADDMERRWAWNQNKLDAMTGSDYTRAAVDDSANRAALNLGIMGMMAKAGKPLSESKFYSQYAQHIDMRGRGGLAEQNKAKILAEGFKSNRVNAIPPFTGDTPNIISRSYAPQPGDVVYLAPKEAWTSTPNGMKIKPGWVPTDDDIVHITDASKPMYQYYLEKFAK